MQTKTTPRAVIGTEAFREACQRVIIHCPNPYAKSYAGAGVGLVTADAPRHELEVQALYILSNTTHWRGDEARMVKQLLRDFSRAAANGGVPAPR
jgi:hypothetical protein